ncbi:MAG: ABC transporter substrate-binding protein [Planctomycetes bacterium]|nr:ABC transporter substrate-binding protein [Planctomycetota bacterium]NUQ34723.1 ABC transporter substrate-binding protein [Planctomycetaceae bacterium]
MKATMKKTITVAHSPDADDAFMFHALVNNKVDTGDLDIRHELCDIQTLNERAKRCELEVTAISFHAYPYVADKYVITRPGASMGDRYGPIIVTAKPMNPSELRNAKVATPGPLTSAYLALKLYEPSIKPVHMNFNDVQHAVLRGDVDAGVIIHEGQVTYNDMKLYKLVDLGEWWYTETKLPLPLGCNVALRSLGTDVIRGFSRAFSKSIRYALDHRDEALDHALTYGRGLARERADKFVGMYVNDYTVDIGDIGMKAVREFLKRGREAGIVTAKADPEWV